MCPEKDCEFIFPGPQKAKSSNDKLASAFSTTENAPGQAGQPLPPVDPGHDRNAEPEPPHAPPPRGMRSQDRVKELADKARAEIDVGWATNPFNKPR